MPQLPVLCVIGTRPEAIKMLPVIVALRESRYLEPVVVVTGQHGQLVQRVLDIADVVPDADLGASHLDPAIAGAGLNGLVATIMTRFDAFCRERYGIDGTAVGTTEDVITGRLPAAVLVHGDTTSAMAIALAAFHLRLPVAHVEAGLRTQSTLSPFPEELNRRLIAVTAAFHLAPTTESEENLVRENVPHNLVFVTGNTAIDALRLAAENPVVPLDPRVAAAWASGDRLVLVTGHRRESWGGGLADVASAVAALAAQHPDVRFIWPMHPNPVVRAEVGPALATQPNIIACEPLDYREIATVLGRCVLVITDSGGLQEEAPSLSIPVLVTRWTTERGEGVAAGTLKLVGTDVDAIVREAHHLLTHEDDRLEMGARENPYGDGNAARRIVDALETLTGHDTVPQRFGPGFSRLAVLRAAGFGDDDVRQAMTALRMTRSEPGS